MDFSYRIDDFPCSAEETVGRAAALSISDAPSLVTFTQSPGNLIVAHQVSGSSACPCHTTVAPWAVAELERISIVRFDDPDPLSSWVEGVALCGLHNGLEVAARLQGKLAHTCIVTGERWREFGCSDRTCCPEDGRPMVPYPRPSWSGLTSSGQKLA
jgi:hypothetical protein